VDGRLNGKGHWEKENGAYYEGDLIERPINEISKDNIDEDS